MALPLAAIGAAAASLIAQASRDQLAKQEKGRAASGSITNTIRQATGVVVGAAAGGGAGAALGGAASRVIGSGSIIPGIPTPSQFKQLVQGTGLVPGMSFGRRRRRMNVANVSALRRAGRRVEGFVRLAKSLVSMPGARSKCAIKTRRKKRC